MVDSSVNSPSVDPDAYPSLLETIQSLGKNYRSFDERSSNLPLPTELPVIPGIHIPLQVDESASRDVLYGQGDSPDEATELDSEQEQGLAERTTAGAQASTSTEAGRPSTAFDAGGASALPRDVNLIPSLSTGLGPMPYNNLYGDEPGCFTNKFWVEYAIQDDVLVERVM